MSIAAAKRRRKQIAKRNRHVAKIGRPGLPKKMTAEQSAARLSRLITRLKTIQANKGKKAK